MNKIEEFRKELMGKYYKDMKPIKQDRYMVVKERDGELVGYLLASTFGSLTRNVFTIEDLIVDKKHRGKGLGQEMLQSAINLAKELEADCIEVCTKKDNKAAKKLYESMGFKDRKQTAYRLWVKK